METGYISLAEVAKRLGVSYSLVYKWVEQGRLKAEMAPWSGYRVKEKDCIHPPNKERV